MKNLSTLALLALAGLAAVGAVPLQDISLTSVSLEEQQLSPDSERITLKVSRVDDLVDDNGDVLIERIMGFKLGFDIENDKVLLNGAPVELGPSSIEVEAIILADESLVSGDESVDLTPLTNSLDIGLVTVEVEAMVELVMTDEGIPVRHITVSERVVEINGAQVLQTEAQQHILDIFENGTVVESIVSSDAQTKELPSISEIPDSSVMEPSLSPAQPCGSSINLSSSFSSIRRSVQYVFLGSVVILFFLRLYTFLRSYRNNYTPVDTEDLDAIQSSESDAKVISVVEYEVVRDEKKGLVI